jgi:dolichol kinase
MGVGIYNILSRKLISFKSEDFVKYRWRIYLRPFALLFIFSYLIYGKNQTLILVAVLLFFAILFDVDRISGKFWLSRIFFKDFDYSKPDEKRTFSSITYFLFSCALVIGIFPKMIAIVSILLLIFGDMFGKLFGTAFQRHRFFSKSLEGSLAFLGCGLICSYVLNIVFSFNLNLMILGTIVAAIAEAAFEKIDDNLTVPLTSSLAMTLAHWGGMQLLVR